MNDIECPADALMTKIGSYYEMSMDVKYDPVVETVTTIDDSVIHVIGNYDDQKHLNMTATTMERGLRELFAYVGTKKNKDKRNVLPKALKKTKKQKNRPKHSKKTKKCKKSGGDESDASDNEYYGGSGNESSSSDSMSESESDNAPDNIEEDVESEFNLAEFADAAEIIALGSSDLSDSNNFNLADFVDE